MARVFLGPAGIPIGAKEKKRSAGTIDGIRYVREVGLNAMEVEFVQGVRMAREAAQEAGEVAKELGVRLSVHAPYFINLCSEEKEKVEASIARLEESLDRVRRWALRSLYSTLPITVSSGRRDATMLLGMVFLGLLIG